MGIRLSLIVSVVALTLLASGTVMAQDTFFDDMKGELNPNYWNIYINPDAGTVTQTADGVELTMYQDNSWASSLGGQSVRFACEFSGDFDAQYDFELVDWPTRNGIRLGLNVGWPGSGSAVERVSGDLVVIYGNREVYLTHFPNGIRGITDTADTTGTLRLVRSGNRLFGYFLKDGEWVRMNNSWVTTADPNRIGAHVWGHYRTPGVTARVTNFQITADSIVCPVTYVPIDIKPYSDVNPVNVKSKGVIPVAVLTTEEFDATTINPDTIAFGPNGATPAHIPGHIEDVDADGDLDLMLHFYTDLTGISCSDDSAVLTGTTYDGTDIEGSDMLTPKGCKR